ncbi:MAG: hypothetical protein ACE5I1_07850, partial [bacterium]
MANHAALRNKWLFPTFIFAVLLLAGGSYFLFTNTYKREIIRASERLLKQAQLTRERLQYYEQQAKEDIAFLGEMAIFKKGPDVATRAQLRRYFSKYFSVIEQVIWRSESDLLLALYAKGPGYVDYTTKTILPIEDLPFTDVKADTFLAVNGQKKYAFVKPVFEGRKILSCIIVVFSAEKLFDEVFDHVYLGESAYAWAYHTTDYHNVHKSAGFPFNPSNDDFQQINADIQDGFDGKGTFDTPIAQDDLKVKRMVTGYCVVTLWNQVFGFGFAIREDSILSSMKKTNWLSAIVFGAIMVAI